MELRPILSALRHHKLTTGLLMLQVACTCAIVCNCGFMIAQRVGQMSLPSGITQHVDPKARHQTDLAALRAIPGVIAAAVFNGSLPPNQNQDAYGTCGSLKALTRAIRTQAMGGGCTQPSFYGGGPGFVQALGVTLVAGRDFRPDEYVSDDKAPPAAIISRALATRFYPGEKPPDKSIYPSTTLNQPVRVVGIVSNVLRPNLRRPGNNYVTVIWPRVPTGNSSAYLLRSKPGDRARILKQARQVLLKIGPSRLVSSKGMRTYTEIRAAYSQRDRTMIGLLIAAAIGMLFVTALGIVGLTRFWVQRRTRSIGIRRAIGATRRDILHYFQTGNFLIVTIGVALGVLLAVALNLLLMAHYELPRLPPYYLPASAAALWLLGQLAVLAPALRASHVPPVVATRTV